VVGHHVDVALSPCPAHGHVGQLPPPPSART
jgi:hypothetical protein